MIDDGGAGENVIGYLEGKGDNHLSNPPCYPLGPITGDRMALSFAVSQLTALSNTHFNTCQPQKCKTILAHIVTHKMMVFSKKDQPASVALSQPSSQFPNIYSDSQDDGLLQKRCVF